MKKKTISVILAVVMMFSMCIPAFAGASVDALTGTQKAFGDAALAVYAEGYTSLSTSNAKSVANGVIENFDAFFTSLADFDLSTLQADIRAGFTAALIDDIGAASLKENNPALSSDARIKTAVNNVADSLYNTLREEILANVRVFGESCESLVDQQREIAQLIITALNDSELAIDVTTEAGRTALAEYVYKNFSDLDAYFAVYSEYDAVCTNDASNATYAVWADNNTALTSHQEETAAAIAKPFNDDFSSRSGGSDDIWAKLEEGLKKFFEGFTNGDINDMFGGMGESLNKITSAISGLLEGIFGGGNNDTPTTPTKPSTADNDDFSNTKTGDVAVYAVASVALVAGLALVLTKKKKEDK